MEYDEFNLLNNLDQPVKYFGFTVADLVIALAILIIAIKLGFGLTGFALAIIFLILRRKFGGSNDVAFIPRTLYRYFPDHFNQFSTNGNIIRYTH